ncbi:hypothetical protein [Caenispirillum bisanense]|nr:hypothetical protein [Caenispirillum bisanense]
MLKQSVIDSMIPPLRDLYALWQALGWDQGLPLVADVLRVDLARWRPNAVIIERRDGTYWYRWYGPALRAAFKTDLTGLALDSIPESTLPAGQRQLIEYEFATATERRSPVWRSYKAQFGGEDQVWQRLVLPAAPAEGEPVSLILIVAAKVETPPVTVKRIPTFS